MALAKAAAAAGRKHRVRVLFTPQLTDIYRVAREAEDLLVFAPHMDGIPIGRGNGLVLPESVVAAGARGVILNHCERPMHLADLGRAIRRAEEVGLYSMVCTDTPREALAVAQLSPSIIVAEPSANIGTTTVSDSGYIAEITARIKAIDPEIAVLHAAGIHCGDDVFRVFQAGADGTGSSSGVAKAADPAAMAGEMIAAARRGWDCRACVV